mmetsp:Transcript_59451/g.125954  ORF Transcript_59451/g.125954 Transcript_59451/m.125954 type:complete len:170 (+) Transcript_59451:104-613(+)
MSRRKHAGVLTSKALTSEESCPNKFQTERQPCEAVEDEERCRQGRQRGTQRERRNCRIGVSCLCLQDDRGYARASHVVDNSLIETLSASSSIFPWMSHLILKSSPKTSSLCLELGGVTEGVSIASFCTGILQRTIVMPRMMVPATQPPIVQASQKGTKSCVANSLDLQT